MNRMTPAQYKQTAQAKPTRGKRAQPEDELQIAVIAALRLQFPRMRFWHVPNEGKLPVQYRVKLRKKGVTAGVADVHMVIPPRGRIGVIELKVKPNRLSVAQKAWLEGIDEDGGYHGVAYSVDEAIEFVELWTRLEQNNDN